MEFIVFVVTILLCTRTGHSDTDVKLMAIPTKVSEGASLNLTCSFTRSNSTYASFYFSNGGLIGAVRVNGEKCQDGADGKECYARCSCSSDRSSFSIVKNNVNRTWNKESVRCQGDYRGVYSNDQEITILYGPEVNLAILNTTENATNVRLNCSAKGEPNTFEFRWTLTLGSTWMRNMSDHVTNSGSLSTLIIPKVTYQYMGSYECSVTNNIGVKGDKRGFLSVKGSPRVIGSQDRYVTAKGVSFDINITFLSFPEPDNTTILRKGSVLPPESELSFTVSPALVTELFYNSNVSVDGYVMQLRFSKFETKHQGHYQLYIWNMYDYYYSFYITISDKPDPPADLTIEHITTNSAVISWTPMEDNGHEQTFTVICQSYNGTIQENITLNHTLATYIIESLEISTEYHVILYASNVKGTSDNITASFKTTSESIFRVEEGSTPGGAIIGGAIGTASGMILIVCFVVVLICRRRQSLKQSGQHSLRQKNSTEESDDDHNDGLKVNVLYESAGPNYPEQSDQSTAATSGDVYAVVNKPPVVANITNTNGNVEVNNTLKGEPVYTQVQRTDNRKAEKDAEETQRQVQVIRESSLYSEVKKNKT